MRNAVFNDLSIIIDIGPKISGILKLLSLLMDYVKKSNDTSGKLNTIVFSIKANNEYIKVLKLIDTFLSENSFKSKRLLDFKRYINQNLPR